MTSAPAGNGYFIGIISGTSVDAVDCALIETSPQHPVRLLSTHTGHIPDSLRKNILDLCTGQAPDLQRLGETDVEVALAFAESVQQLLDLQGMQAEQITAIGSHGQTVYHHPVPPFPFSMQLGDPNTIAQHTGITTIADFRRRDMAAGGQGAPLAPLFHQHFFYEKERCRAILNIGGISNITWLHPDAAGTPAGFDTGPGNVLMDWWIGEHQQKPYDVSGQWAASGEIVPGLLESLLQEPYFALPSPKSTGRELFNATWLRKHLQNWQNSKPEDVQRTLLELTATSVAQATRKTRPENATGDKELIVCGGGAHNKFLMQRLQELLPGFTVSDSQQYDLHPDWVEAATFAWLASRTIHRQAIDTRRLTGARTPIIMGGIYYA